MPRRRVSISLDAAVLRAAKAAADREGKPVEAIIEDALRRRLWGDLVERVRARAALDPDEAMQLAVAESKVARLRR